MAKLNENYGSVFTGLDSWAKSMDEILASAVPVPTKKQRKKMAKKQEQTFIVKVTVKETAPVESAVETTAEATEVSKEELVNATNVNVVANAGTEVETDSAEEAETTAKPPEAGEGKNESAGKPSIPKLNPGKGKKGKEKKQNPQPPVAPTAAPVQQPQAPVQQPSDQNPTPEVDQQQQQPLKIAATIVGFNAFGQAIDINGTPLVGINGLPLVINPATGLFEEAIPVPPTVQIPSQTQA